MWVNRLEQAELTRHIVSRRRYWSNRRSAQDKLLGAKANQVGKVGMTARKLFNFNLRFRLYNRVARASRRWCFQISQFRQSRTQVGCQRLKIQFLTTPHRRRIATAQVSPRL